MESPNHTFKISPSGLGLFYGWFGGMHSRLDLIITGMDEGRCARLLDDMYSNTERLEKMLNRFDPDSDLYQLNSLGKGSYPIDDELIEIIARALAYKSLTLGAFDIAIGSENYDPTVQYIDIDFENRILTKTADGVTLDMGGYAKGLALEAMIEILRAGGVENALVSFGNSSVYGIGNHPAGKPWNVGVEQTAGKTVNTNGGAGGQDGVFIDLCDCGMSTSGNNPTNRGHIISPYTRRPVTDSRLVSVAGASPLDCEVLSTALFVAMAEDGYEDKSEVSLDRTQPARDILSNFAAAGISRAVDIAFTGDSLAVTELIAG